MFPGTRATRSHGRSLRWRSFQGPQAPRARVIHQQIRSGRGTGSGLVIGCAFRTSERLRCRRDAYSANGYGVVAMRARRTATTSSPAAYSANGYGVVTGCVLARANGYGVVTGCASRTCERLRHRHRMRVSHGRTATVSSPAAYSANGYGVVPACVGEQQPPRASKSVLGNERHLLPVRSARSQSWADDTGEVATRSSLASARSPGG